MKTFIRSVGGLLVSAVLLAPVSVLAHTDEYLATLEAPHDGQLRVAGPYHLELVAAKEPAASAEKPLMVYVTDHAGTPVSTTGASGTVTLLGGGKKATVPLVPAGENALKAAAVYASTPALKAVVSVRMGDKTEAGARFEPLVGGKEKKDGNLQAAPAADQHAGHH